MIGTDAEILAETAENARARLLAERTSAGHWEGELSSSALSTATAVTALALAASAASTAGAGSGRDLFALARGGRAWLARHQNADGGFGDTVDSPSNLSTTALCWTALKPALEGEPEGAVDRARASVEGWLRERLGPLDARSLARALEDAYGDDRTFAVPILTACALGGALEGEGVWDTVPALPFELAAVPRRLFRWMRMPVVSYALPALIAIGHAIDHHRPSRNPLARLARTATRERALRLLERIQPASGGFLEAVPLTSFVALALLASGRAGHPAVPRGLDFLARSVRPDGSWPIDTNLATWLTTLACGALGADAQDFDRTARGRILSWLLAQQYRVVHPYTGAAPGGWAWTDLPGGVPDADDTSGALLALSALADGSRDVPGDAPAAALAGARWLVGLQNRDGGIPTFCRGWGRLPFDRSCPDLSAHAMRAWAAWSERVPPADRRVLARAGERAASFLVRTQRADGAWVPLWFGSQAEPRLENPLYGTSRVLRAASAHAPTRAWHAAIDRGLAWMLDVQDAGGGFGAAAGVEPSVEETALALEALCDCARAGLRPDELRPRIESAAGWLCRATDSGRRFEPRPIGLYFARLWYSERLYPLVFTVSALGRARAVLEA